MLEARAITFTYRGAKEPLYREFNLSVAPDERVALSAPSGFGKTTLCRLLAGYEKPQAGEVLVDGEPLPKHGMCPVQLIGQHPERMVDPRVRMGDTLIEAGLWLPELLGAQEAVGAPSAPLASRASASTDISGISRVAAAAAAVADTSATPGVSRALGVSEAVDEASYLLDNLGIQRQWLSRYPHELSGGELQRFCIARALAAHPRYLIADEISTMLDAVTQAQIWSFLLHETQERGIGIVLVSHSAALSARIATRTVDLT